MRFFKITAFLLTMLIIALSGCDLQMPQEVHVTGSPSYELPAGTMEFDLMQELDLENQIETALQDYVDTQNNMTLSVVNDVYTITITESMLVSDILGETSIDMSDIEGITPTTLPAVSGNLPAAVSLTQNASDTVPAGTYGPGDTTGIDSNSQLFTLGIADFVSGTIGTGTFGITITPDHAGVTIDLDSIELVQDATTLKTWTDGELTGHSISLDLDGIGLLSSNDLTFNYSFTYTIADGTTLTDGIDNGVNLAFDMSVTQFSTLVIDDSGNGDFAPQGGSADSIIDPALSDMVKSIQLDPAHHSLDFTITNNLPADITITISSDVLLGVGGTASVSYAAGDDATKSITLLDTIDLTSLADLGGGNFGVDFDFELSFDGYSEALQQMTLTNVTLGNPYSFSGSVALDATVDTVTLGGISETGNYPDTAGGETPFNLADMLDMVPAGINLSTIEMNAAVNGITDFSGDVVLLGIDGGSVSDVLAGTWNGGVGAEDPDPTHADYSGLAFTTSFSLDTLSDLLNQRPTALELAYAVNVDNATIDPSDLTQYSIDASISVPMALEIVPAEGVNQVFDGTNYLMVEFDMDGETILPYTITDDLLGRTVADEMEEDYGEFFDMLQSAALNMQLNNDSGMSAMFRIYQAGAPDFDKQLPITTGRHRLEMTDADITFIRENLFTPELQVWLPEGTLSFNPEPALTFALWLTVLAEIDYTFPLQGEE